MGPPRGAALCFCLAVAAGGAAVIASPRFCTVRAGSGGAEMTQDSQQIGFDDFIKVDVRVGTIARAEPYPEARRPSFKLWVDFGAELGVRKTSAQVTRHYALEELPGRQVAAVVNFPPKQIGKFMSEILVLGFPDAEGEVVLVVPDKDVPNGGRLY